MCGIVGYVTLTDDTRVITKERFFKEGLYANALRGMDSTGIMSVREDFLWSWQKQAVPAYEFICSSDYIERKTDTWAAVGHSRSATIGGISTDNAHPFKHGPVLLVHNGTLRSTFGFDHNPADIEVDSDILCLNLSKAEPEDAHKVLTKVQGAYALVWFDTRDETINFARNSERPFHMGINAAEDMMVFSSDGFLLNFITQRLQDSTARPYNIYSLGSGTLLKYKKGSLVPEVTTIHPFAWSVGGTAHSPAQRTVVNSTTGDYSPGTSDRPTIRIGAGIPRPGGVAAEKGKCKVNNVYRKIPEAHSAMVRDWYSLDHDVDMFFEPGEFIQWGTTEPDGMTLGQIYHPEWDCWFDARVEDVTTHTAKIYNVVPWTVRVIGVDHSDQKNIKGGCTFICKPVYYRWEGDDKAKANKTADQIQTSIDKQEEIDKDLSDKTRKQIQLDIDAQAELDQGLVPWLYPGPNNKLIQEDAFNILTAGGCVMCGGNIFLNDADDIEWVGEMCNQPLCLPCLDQSTNDMGV